MICTYPPRISFAQFQLMVAYTPISLKPVILSYQGIRSTGSNLESRSGKYPPSKVGRGRPEPPSHSSFWPVWSLSVWKTDLENPLVPTGPGIAFFDIPVPYRQKATIKLPYFWTEESSYPFLSAAARKHGKERTMSLGRFRTLTPEGCVRNRDHEGDRGSPLPEMQRHSGTPTSPAPSFPFLPVSPVFVVSPPRDY